jgi:hypothetical protein
MTADEAKTLGRAALERLDKVAGLEREHCLRDIGTALDMLGGMVTRLEEGVRVAGEALSVQTALTQQAEATADMSTVFSATRVRALALTDAESSLRRSLAMAGAGRHWIAWCADRLADMRHIVEQEH